MEIKVEQAASEKHFDFIATHFEETIALWEDYEVTPESIGKQKSQIMKWSEEKNVHLTIAAIEGTGIVGFNSLYISKTYNGSSYGKIAILYVLSEQRGKGIAAKLKIEGESWLRSQGVDTVITEIDAKNKRMLEITEKAGFKIKSYTFERKI